MASSSYALWWDDDAEGVVERLRQRIVEILKGVPEPPASTVQRHSEGSSSYPGGASGKFTDLFANLFKVQHPMPQVNQEPVLDLLRESGEALGQAAAIFASCAGLVKSSAEWRRTGL